MGTGVSQRRQLHPCRRRVGLGGDAQLLAACQRQLEFSAGSGERRRLHQCKILRAAPDASGLARCRTSARPLGLARRSCAPRVRCALVRLRPVASKRFDPLSFSPCFQYPPLYGWHKDHRLEDLHRVLSIVLLPSHMRLQELGQDQFPQHRRGRRKFCGRCSCCGFRGKVNVILVKRKNRSWLRRKRLRANVKRISAASRPIRPPLSPHAASFQKP